MRRWLPLLLGLLFALPSGAQAADYVPGRVIVQYERGADAAERADAREDTGVRRLAPVGLARTEVVKVTDGESVPETVAELRREPGVALVTPDVIGNDFAIPNDPQFPRLWGLRNIAQDANLFSVDDFTDLPLTAPLAGVDINAQSAWDTTTGSDSVVVAVIDGGFHYELPDIAPQVFKNPGETGGGKENDNVDNDGNGEVDDWQGFDFVGASSGAPSTDDDPFDENLHGTHVAGTVGARGNDGVGVTGVAQRVRLLNVRHTDSTGSAAFSSTLNAIDYAGDMGADVANGSFGFDGSSVVTTLFSQAMAAHPGTLYVVAAGNGGGDSAGDNVDAGTSGDNEVAPCEAPAANLICVAATDQADRIAGFSNFGTTSVDLGAPGVDILSDWARATHFTSTMPSAAAFNVDWPSPGGWSRTTASPFDTPDGGAITDSSGDYAPSTVNVATSRAFTVPAGATGCELRYFRKVSLGAGDSTDIEVLRNNVVHDAVSPTSGARNSFFDIAAGLGGSSNVQVRLRVTSDATGNADGMSVSNMRLDCDPRKGQPGGFAYIDGTSMASPHVAGAAALLVAKNPTLSVAQLRGALLGTGDAIGSLAGRTVTGRRLDVAAAVNSVPFPSPAARASVVTPLRFSRVPRTLQLSRTGTVTITVTGAPGTAGNLVLKTSKKVTVAAKKKRKKRVLVLARKRFRIPASGRVKVRLKVSGKALRTLKKAKRLGATLTVTAGRLKATKRVTVKAPKKKKRKKRKRR